MKLNVVAKDLNNRFDGNEPALVAHAIRGPVVAVSDNGSTLHRMAGAIWYVQSRTQGHVVCDNHDWPKACPDRFHLVSRDKDQR